MKKLIFYIFAAIYGMSAFAQEATTGTAETKRPNKTAGAPVCYIGFSLGVNNPSGIVGFDFNIPLAPHVTLDAGAGPSTWGNKLYIGSKYYLRPVQRGWAFGGGITFNSGNENLKTRINTINGRSEVTLALKPQTNIYISAYHYWTIGRRHNRFFLELGRSVHITQVKYTNLRGPELTSDSDRVLKRLAPGGTMIGAGFSFGLYNRHSS